MNKAMGKKNKKYMLKEFEAAKKKNTQKSR